jgi:hypothetical protein
MWRSYPNVARSLTIHDTQAEDIRWLLALFRLDALQDMPMDHLARVIPPHDRNDMDASDPGVGVVWHTQKQYFTFRWNQEEMARNGDVEDSGGWVLQNQLPRATRGYSHWLLPATTGRVFEGRKEMGDLYLALRWPAIIWSNECMCRPENVVTVRMVLREGKDIQYERNETRYQFATGFHNL